MHYISRYKLIVRDQDFQEIGEKSALTASMFLAISVESSNCPIEERKGKLVCSFNMERRTSRGKYNYIITEKKLFRNNVLFFKQEKKFQEMYSISQ